MINYLKEHQLIIKSFPFVKFFVKTTSHYYNYHTNLNNNEIFWCSKDTKYWNGNVVNGTYNIKTFLVKLYNWLIQMYEKI